jgi:RimJ/RimL family protein N-acetyltransferase
MERPPPHPPSRQNVGMKSPQFTFARLTEADIPRLHQWMGRPHVAKWWKGERSLEEVRETYLPRIADDSDATPYFACLDGVPVAYIQSYVAVDFGTGWWPGQHDRGVLGIDQFIADAANIGRGLGTELVRQFAHFLFADPAVHRIQVDPRPDNVAAIRCYEKVGFRRDAEITTPDGPALLMVLERRSLVHVHEP